MKLRLQLMAAVFFFILSGSCTKESTDTPSIPVAENIKAMETELLSIVNSHRSSLGFSSLEFSEVAYDFANSHTDYMISQGSLSHDNFSSRASSIATQTNAAYVAENVAKDYTSAAAAMDGWMASSEHRKTIEGDFTHTAVSVKKDSQGNYYYTQLFYR